MRTLHELFVDKLKDIHDAERRITRALPGMIKAAESQELTQGFEKHLRQTEQQIHRLERVFSGLHERPGRKTCRGMEGILAEGEELLGQKGGSADGTMDAALIAAAQEVEHYEISAYGTLKAWAEQMGHDDAARLLGQTLDEEKETDQKLNQLASTINHQAMSGDGQSSRSEDGRMAGSRRGSSRGSDSSRGGSRSRGSSSRATATEDWTAEEGGSSTGSSRGSSSRGRSASRGGSSAHASRPVSSRSRTASRGSSRSSTHSRSRSKSRSSR